MKKIFTKLLKDERGISLSTESLIFLVGTGIVASVVIGVITVLLVGKDKDGTGGMAKSVSDKINGIVDDIGQ
ncbi:hypothetical protein [Wukongibacter baidiensis]